ncbi:MAG: extracellular solute-binding protein [Clostridia bacterium]|nr:extracellular solute-binding protein [Clostridia bacterium]
MLAGLFSSCGDKKGDVDKEKIPVLFSIPEESAEKLSVTGKAVYTDGEELGALYRGENGRLSLLRYGAESFLDDDLQPTVWEPKPEEEYPRAVWGDKALYQDRLTVGKKEIPLDPAPQDNYLGFWSFDGVDYLVSDRVSYDMIDMEKETDRYIVLYPVTEEGLGDPVRVEGTYMAGFSCGTDGEWNYFMKESVLYRTDGKTLQNLGNPTPFGVNLSTLRNIVPLDEEKVLLLSGKNLFLLKPGEESGEEEGEGRGKVVIGMDVNVSGYLSELIARYNMTSEEKVELREYVTVEKLNLAILSREVDIVASIAGNVMKNYARKGVLAPLDEVIGDVIGSGDIFPNVLEAGKIGGKVYLIPDAAAVYGMMLPVKVLEEKGGEFADMRDLLATLDSLSDQSFYKSWTRDIVMGHMDINGAIYAWVDEEAGTCSFEDESFIDLLKFCSRFAPDSATTSANSSGRKPLFRSLWQMYAPGSYEDGLAYEFPKGSGKTDSPYGIAGRIFPCPTGKGTGYALNPGVLFGVAETSEVKKSAGEFLSWVLSDENQYPADLNLRISMSYDGMPVRISSFRKLMEENETEEQGYEVFLNADHYTFGDGYSEIGKVVKEEALRFFAGEITAEKAAEYIQNRVSIYLAEQG